MTPFPRRTARALFGAFVLALAGSAGSAAVLERHDAARAAVEPATPLRVATFNVALFADEADRVRQRLAGGGDPAARALAAIIQRQRPDILLLNEVDYDAAGALADVLQREYLEVGQSGEAAIRYDHRFLAPVNTGVPSGMDLNGDGEVGGEGRKRGEDAFGFGLHPGQYGMLVLSRFPIREAEVRTFQKLPWAHLPDARRPTHPDGRWWYDDAVWPKLRLSSKSHWDVPIDTPLGTVHLLAAHPTPPTFDGPEDRNGRRNADELALWRHYLDDVDGAAAWLCDDQGRCGGLPAGARFVIAGDLNNDPMDGSGHREAIAALIDHPRVLRHAFPASEGGVASARARGGPNRTHRGDPAHDTSQFGPPSGNLHLDYVLPSLGFRVVDSGVFWPAPGQPGADWAEASDHRMVWIDLVPADPSP
jgi:endonuclease/exonuclease/phosphatase family metal-dependent hydrolase